MSSYMHDLDWIDRQEEALLKRVKQWASINTYSFNLDGLQQLVPIVQSAFRILGGESQLLDLPPIRALQQNGAFQSQPLGQALQIRKRPQAPIQILFGGHLDTVFPSTSSFQTVEMKEKGILRGPGVADMKGGIAILLTALEAFERSSFADKLGWEILLTPDEEIGSPGSASLYQAAAKRHHIGLIFEPSFPDGAFVSERKGSATFTVAVKGRAAHVGRDFAKGRSAVFALARFLHHLETLRHQEDLTVNVADLEGKGPINIVPPLATCRINLRSSDEKRLQEASLQLKKFVQNSEEEGIQIEVVQDTFRSPKPFHLDTQKLFEAYAICAQELDIPFKVRSTGGVCDGNLLAGAGLPTLDTAGVVGGDLHTYNEYLVISSLVERAKLTALFLFKCASKEIEAFHGK